MSYELWKYFLISHRQRVCMHMLYSILYDVRVYFELMQQYPTNTLEETCHFGFECTKYKEELASWIFKSSWQLIILYQTHTL